MVINGTTAPTLNPMQLRTVQWLTRRIEALHHDGAMTYQLRKIEGTRDHIFMASNSEALRWFETSDHFMACIGPRGRIVRPEGTLADRV